MAEKFEYYIVHLQGWIIVEAIPPISDQNLPTKNESFTSKIEMFGRLGWEIIAVLPRQIPRKVQTDGDYTIFMKRKIG